MIATLTVNPAVDRILTVDRFVFEDRTYILSSSEAAGGRGITASREIASFGGDTLAVAPSGGSNGKVLERLLATGNYPFETYPIEQEIRVNLTITDQDGLTMQLNQRGPRLTEAEQEGLADLVLKRMDGASWLMLCGSLPPGVTAGFYGRLITAARKAGVKVLLDTDGEPLIEGIEAGPTVAAPNQFEAERLLGSALVTKNQFADAVRRIQTMGAEWAIVSLGNRGAIGGFGNELVEVTPPRVHAVCPIGAGDALSAVFVWSLREGHDPVEALRWGVAAGTASAMLAGLTLANREQTAAVYPDVSVRAISG